MHRCRAQRGNDQREKGEETGPQIRTGGLDEGIGGEESPHEYRPRTGSFERDSPRSVVPARGLDEEGGNSIINGSPPPLPSMGREMFLGCGERRKRVDQD